MVTGRPSDRSAQLPLPPFFSPRATFDQFWPGGNEQLVHHLRTAALGSGELFLFLWGAPESGKSHLLQAACHCAHRHDRTVCYLPLRDLRSAGAAILCGLEARQLVCLDDIETILGDSTLEQALFNLFNALRERRHCLMVTASQPPRDLPTGLPDLRSRWSWGTVYRINPLNEEDTLKAIELCARELGLDLPPRVKRFLISRCRRDFGFLRRLLGELDGATLVAQCKLTVPFVKRILDRQA